IATSGAEGDADAKGAGGSAGIHVGVSKSEVDVKPVIEASIGAGSVIAIGGDLTVRAISGPAATPVDQSPDAGDVDVIDDTLQFGNHGLTDGDTVLYVNKNGGAAIGGLTDGREYGVLRVDKDKIQLGNRFDGAVNVDSARDTITFGSPHGFQD